MLNLTQKTQCVTSRFTDSVVKMPKTESIALCLYFALLLWAFPACAGGSDGGAPGQEVWCVAKNNAEDAALQTAVEWACGAGGADCGAIQGGGPCYDPSSVQNTASYAFNDYFRKHAISDENCNFDNNAAITSLNPSYGNCKLPSSMLVSNGSFGGSASSMGLRPGEDTSDCTQVFGPSIITLFLLLHSVSLILSVK